VTAPNSETAYTYTVTARNKAGSGEASPQSNARRAVGAPAAPTGASLSEAETGGAGRAVTVSFNELTAAQRNGAQAGEVSYRATFSDGRTMAITNGQKVGGFTNGKAVNVRITSVANTDGASYSSAPSTESANVTPYGAPGTPSVSGQNGAREQQTVTFSWSAPAANSHDVAQIRIRVDGGSWQNVANSGSKTVNTRAYNKRVTFEAQSVNSRGTAGAVASTAASSGDAPPPPPPPKTEWHLVVGGQLPAGHRTCMDPRTGTNFSPGPPASCAGGHWANDRSNPNPTLLSKCWILRSGGIYWYQQNGGGKSINNGLYVKGIHVTLEGRGSDLGSAPPSGMPPCG
jgi:hypothetical protein